MAQQPTTMTAALGADDYRQLYGLLTSDDAATRTQGADLAKKLTPAEQRDFFDFQQQLHQGHGDRGRADNSIGGVPPELAVTGALGIGRAVAGAGLTGASRLVAGAKAAVEQAAPAVKYEATKTILEKMGVPTPLAITAAIAVSGYKAKAAAAKVEPTPAATSAPSAAPPATSPGAAVPSVPSPAPTIPATVAPPPMGKALKILMTEGGLKLEEANQALKWLKEGIPMETVQDRIQAARQLAGKPGFVKLPSSADVAAAVKDRNATGRWPEGPK